jgi:hypothetical protein
MLRQNSQQFDLLFHIQLVNGCADFDNTAHWRIVSPVEGKCKMGTHRRSGASNFLANGLALILTFFPWEKEQPSPASFFGGNSFSRSRDNQIPET